MESLYSTKKLEPLLVCFPDRFGLISTCDIGRMENCDSLTRADLRNYAPASNLQLNETIKRLIAEGQVIYHFGFGQSPFPAMDEFCQKLSEYAGKNQYLAVAGMFFFIIVFKSIITLRCMCDAYRNHSSIVLITAICISLQ